MVHNLLARQADYRHVVLLEDNSVQLSWDWTVIHLRQSDLIALDDALEANADLVGWQAEQRYTLWLDDNPLHFTWADLLCFRDLVAAARGSLARRCVRWVDVDIRLEVVEDVQEGTLFGYN